MIVRLIPITTIALLTLTACMESPTETSKDVSEARHLAADNTDSAKADADQDVAVANKQVAEAKEDFSERNQDARKKLSAVEAEAMIVKAKADYEVAITEANGRHDIAKEQCDGLSGVTQDACISSNEARLTADQALAIAKRNAALVEAEYHE